MDTESLAIIDSVTKELKSQLLHHVGAMVSIDMSKIENRASIVHAILDKFWPKYWARYRVYKGMKVTIMVNKNHPPIKSKYIDHFKNLEF